MEKRFHVNLGIAKSHQIAGQLVGLQLATANILALVVSASSVVAGATMLAIQQFPAAWPLWLAAGGIGIGLAFLIEGLTLSALIRIRVAGREIRAVEVSERKVREKRLAVLTFPDPADASYPVQRKRYHQAQQLIEREYRRTCRQHTRLARRNRRTSFVLALGGCVASMCAGGLFYHAILAGMGLLVSSALSAVFTLAVTGTFVSSEVFKDLQEQAIREAFTNGHLAESAMRQETRMQSLWAVYANIGTYLKTSEALQVVADSGKLLVASILEELRQDLHYSFVSSFSSDENAQPASEDKDTDRAASGSAADAPEPSQPISAQASPTESTQGAQLRSVAGSQSASTGDPQSAPVEGSRSAPASASEPTSEGQSLTQAVTETEQVPQTVPAAEFSSEAQPEMLASSLTSQMGTAMNDLSPLTQPASNGAEDTSWPANEYAAELARKSSKKLRQEVLVQQEDREIQIKLDRRSARLDPRARLRVVLAQAQQQGVTLTYPQIASAARVSRSTVQRHIKTLRLLAGTARQLPIGRWRFLHSRTEGRNMPRMSTKLQSEWKMHASLEEALFRYLLKRPGRSQRLSSSLERAVSAESKRTREYTSVVPY